MIDHTKKKNNQPISFYLLTQKNFVKNTIKGVLCEELTDKKIYLNVRGHLVHRSKFNFLGSSIQLEDIYQSPIKETLDILFVNYKEINVSLEHVLKTLETDFPHLHVVVLTEQPAQDKSIITNTISNLTVSCVELPLDFTILQYLHKNLMLIPLLDCSQIKVEDSNLDSNETPSVSKPTLSSNTLFNPVCSSRQEVMLDKVDFDEYLGMDLEELITTSSDSETETLTTLSTPLKQDIQKNHKKVDKIDKNSSKHKKSSSTKKESKQSHLDDKKNQFPTQQHHQKSNSFQSSQKSTIHQTTKLNSIPSNIQSLKPLVTSEKNIEKEIKKISKDCLNEAETFKLIDEKNRKNNEDLKKENEILDKYSKSSQQKNEIKQKESSDLDETSKNEGKLKNFEVSSVSLEKKDKNSIKRDVGTCETTVEKIAKNKRGVETKESNLATEEEIILTMEVEKSRTVNESEEKTELCLSESNETQPLEIESVESVINKGMSLISSKDLSKEELITQENVSVSTEDEVIETEKEIEPQSVSNTNNDVDETSKIEENVSRDSGKQVYSSTKNQNKDSLFLKEKETFETGNFQDEDEINFTLDLTCDNVTTEVLPTLSSESNSDETFQMTKEFSKVDSETKDEEVFFLETPAINEGDSEEVEVIHFSVESKKNEDSTSTIEDGFLNFVLTDNEEMNESEQILHFDYQEENSNITSKSEYENETSNYNELTSLEGESVMNLNQQNPQVDSDDMKDARITPPKMFFNQSNNIK